MRRCMIPSVSEFKDLVLTEAVLHEGDRNFSVCCATLEVLKHVGGAPLERYVPELTPLLQHSSLAVRRGVSSILTQTSYLVAPHMLPASDSLDIPIKEADDVVGGDQCS